MACVLFAGAIVLIEVGLQRDRAPLRLMWKVVGALLRNPLIVAPLAGVCVSAAQVPLGAPVDTFLKLLGAAASRVRSSASGCFSRRSGKGPAPHRGAASH